MAAPTYDAISSGTMAAGTSNTLTVSHTTSGSNRFLLVATSVRTNSGSSISGVTYAGNAMTLVDTQADGAGATMQLWAYTAPASGANDIVVTQTNFDRMTFIGASWSDADQTTPYGSVAKNTTSTSQAATISADQNLLAHVLVQDYDNPAAPVYTATGTSQTERVELRQDYIYTALSTQTGSGSTTSTWTFSGASRDSNAIQVIPINGISGSSSATTGTLATGTKTQADVVAGGQTIIRTLSGETFVASFASIQAALTAGISAASSPATGWNALVRDAAVNPITWVRTSATIATGTLAAVAGYAITADEVLTDTIPASALTLNVAIIATPTITVNEGAVLSAYTGTTNGSGVATVDLTSDQPGVRVLVRAYIGGVEVARTTTLPFAPAFDGVAFDAAAFDVNAFASSSP